MGHRRMTTRALVSLALPMALALAPRAEAAFPLRSPQTVFQPGPLQSDLNGAGESIDVLTDQVVNASWIPTLVGCNFVFVMASLDTAGAETVGVYSTSQASPTLCPLLPSGARRGWYVACHLVGSTLFAYVFDETNSIVSSASYPGFDLNHTGLYLQGSGGTWFTEDSRNGGKAQALSFAGTDAYYGTVFLCFERSPYDPAASTFASEVLLVEPQCGDPVLKPTWGQLKALYR